MDLLSEVQFPVFKCVKIYIEAYIENQLYFKVIKRF